MRITGHNVTWILHNLAALVLCVLFLFAGKADSQTSGTAAIQGVITDQSGAVIPNAKVAITNISTSATRVLVTNADGTYSLPNTEIGTYTIDVTASGFEHYTRTNVVLEVGSSIAVNISMTVGAVGQNIEVKANGLALQTEDTSFKQTIDQKTVTELPLNGRQVTSLITLSGGSANANEGSDLQGSKTFFSSVVVSVAGGQGNATDYRLDGGDHNDYMTNVNLPFPFPDAVAQFSVESTAMGAQSGLHPGGLVNVVTRSGSNDWHGSAFEFIRNNAIDATNFFSTSKDTLHQNQYGGTFGGRIIRNKLFGFAGYQRTKADQSQSLTTAYVPTSANLQGDFSASDPTIQLLDPATGIKLINNKYSDTPGVTWNPNPNALALDKFLPATTAANGQVTYAIPSQTAENQFVTRVDWTINQKHSLYGRYFIDGYQSPAFFSPTNVLITTQAGELERAQGITLGETYVVSSSLVNSFHATATRRRDNRGAAATGVNPATIGLDIYSAAAVGMQLSVSNKWSMYCGTCFQAHFNVNTFSFADDVNWVHGNHQVGFGGEYVRSELNVSNVYEGNGNFGFTGIYSQKGPSGNSVGGTGADANLDFLTGSLNSFVQSSSQQNALRAPIPSLYIQDTYHATKKLVLSAGVRWDPEVFPVDYFNRGSTFSMNNFLNNAISKVYTSAPAGMLFYGDQGVPRAFTQNTPWQFSPRVGATLDPFGTGKTVFRVGSALVYDEPNLFTGQHVNQNPPFSAAIANIPVGSPLNFTNPWLGGTTPGNPFPLPFPPSASTSFVSSQIFVLPTHWRPPYTIQWTASVQQDLGRGWQFQLDYIGSKTSFNPYGSPLDPAVYIPGTCGAGPCSTLGNTASRFALTLANPTQGPKYQGGSIGNVGSLVLNSGANATYNGMITTLQHRLSTNFVFLANYTWSHCIDIQDNGGDEGAVSIQNPANVKGDRGSCGYDFRDVFNTTVVATSHFPLTGLPATLLNKWELAPLIHATDGAPFTVTSGVDNSLTDVGNDRPNVANPNAIYTRQKIRSGPSANAQYLNASAFTQNPTGTFGDSGRFAYRGPKFLQTDAALSRMVPLYESLNLDIRLEAFNVLNHPNFSTPGSSGYIGSSTSLVSSTFGRITATPNNYSARIFQAALKLTF